MALLLPSPATVEPHFLANLFLPAPGLMGKQRESGIGLVRRLRFPGLQSFGRIRHGIALGKNLAELVTPAVAAVGWQWTVFDRF